MDKRDRVIRSRIPEVLYEAMHEQAEQECLEFGVMIAHLLALGLHVRRFRPSAYLGAGSSETQGNYRVRGAGGVNNREQRAC